jgi:hypothetical protein
MPFPSLVPTAAHAQAGDAAEEADFAALKAGPTITGARRFLHDHPLGKHAPEARAILDGLTEKTAWDESVALNSRDAYEDYLKLYPNGQFADEARRRIKDLAAAPTFVMHAGMALEGRISGQPSAGAPDQCRAACASDGTCRGYDFSYGERACNLFSEVEAAVRRDGFAAGTIGEVRIKDPPPPAPAPQPEPAPPPVISAPAPPSPPVSNSGFVEVEGMDFPGASADVYFRRDISYPACQEICRADPRCRAYTYNTVRSACFIKSYIMDEVPYPGAISGYRPDTPQPPGVDRRGDFDQSPNTDFPGADLGQTFGVTYDQCLDLCRGNAGCRAYTYNVGKMACFIKWGAVYRKPFEGAVSGVRR